MPFTNTGMDPEGILVGKVRKRKVQFSHSVMSDSLQPHGLQHSRLPCPSPTPGAYSNSCPSNRWCHPTISSSVFPFSFNLSQHHGLFQLVSSSPDSQSIGVSASASVLPVIIQDWFPLGWTGWISLQRESQESSPTSQLKSINSLALSLIYSTTHIHTWLLEKL